MWIPSLFPHLLQHLSVVLRNQARSGCYLHIYTWLTPESGSGRCRTCELAVGLEASNECLLIPFSKWHLHFWLTKGPRSPALLGSMIRPPSFYFVSHHELIRATWHTRLRQCPGRTGVRCNGARLVLWKVPLNCGSGGCETGVFYGFQPATILRRRMIFIRMNYEIGGFYPVWFI